MLRTCKHFHISMCNLYHTVSFNPVALAKLLYVMNAFCYSSGPPGTCSRLHMSCITTVHCTHTLKFLPVVLQAILRAVVHNLFTLAHTLIKFTHTYTHIMITHIPVSSLTAHTSSSTDMLIILTMWNARSFPNDSAPVLRPCIPVVM